MLFFPRCPDNVQRIIDDPHAVNTCSFPNRLAVSGAVAAASLRHSEINLDSSLTVVHELEPVIHLAV